ncbi:MAG: dockerin type I domain-containing protein [Nanoarchaeota archaeon]
MQKIMTFFIGFMLLALPLALAENPTTYSGSCYDVNTDGFIDPLDHGMVLSYLGSTTKPEMDYNENGIVDSFDETAVEDAMDANVNNDKYVDPLDIGYVLARLGTNDPTADINGNGIVDTRDVRYVTKSVNICLR